MINVRSLTHVQLVNNHIQGSMDDGHTWIVVVDDLLGLVERESKGINLQNIEYSSDANSSEIAAMAQVVRAAAEYIEPSNSVRGPSLDDQYGRLMVALSAFNLDRTTKR